FPPTLGPDHQTALPGQHVGKTDDGIERGAQLMAHRRQEAALGDTCALRLRARLLERLLLDLAPGDVAQNRDDLVFGGASTRGLIERPTAHLDPDELS